MAYKLPYKGMSRIPSGKGFTINISEDDLKSEKSASPEPPKEISYEGQGGKDYENRPEDAINPEGQGGKDYSDYEDSMSRKASPLDAVGAHSMTSDKYASHLASASEHKAPSDEVIAKRKKEGKKTTGHISDTRPTNTPPKDGMSRKASPLNKKNPLHLIK